MNPLQEYVYLFNGFNIKTRWNQKLPIVGATLDGQKVILQCDNGLVKYSLEGCTLIARSISDMTESEIIEFEGSLINISPQDAIEVIAETDRKKSWGMLKLLSIGVYPFDQSHFDDGTVIKPTNQ